DGRCLVFGFVLDRRRFVGSVGLNVFGDILSVRRDVLSDVFGVRLDILGRILLRSLLACREGHYADRDRECRGDLHFTPLFRFNAGSKAINARNGSGTASRRSIFVTFAAISRTTPACSRATSARAPRRESSRRAG